MEIDFTSNRKTEEKRDWKKKHTWNEQQQFHENKNSKRMQTRSITNYRRKLIAILFRKLQRKIYARLVQKSRTA